MRSLSDDARRHFDTLADDVYMVGRTSEGGYRRLSWTREDSAMREWFTGAAIALGLDIRTDAAGNQWAWWGNPDAQESGFVIGGHLDSCRDGDAFDGPLGVVGGLVAVHALRQAGWSPACPVGVVLFGDTRGARFGVECVGSRLIAGQLDPASALTARDEDGVTMAAAMHAAGHNPDLVGPDPLTMSRIGRYLDVRIDPGHTVAAAGHAVGICPAVQAHGRWRVTWHAGDGGNEALAGLSHFLTGVPATLNEHHCEGGIFDIIASPTGDGRPPQRITAWLRVHAHGRDNVTRAVAELSRQARLYCESASDRLEFDTEFSRHVARIVSRKIVGSGSVPHVETWAHRDASILAAAGVRCASLVVRNQRTSPAERDDVRREDCYSTTAALMAIVKAETSRSRTTPPIDLTDAGLNRRSSVH